MHQREVGGYGNDYMGRGGGPYERTDQLETQADTIFVQNLPTDCNRDSLQQAFGAIGVIKMDRRTGQPRIWIYKDKSTGRGKGEATITYDDANSADAAIKWFNGKEVLGKVVTVQFATRRRGGGFGSSRGGGAGFRGGYGRGGGYGRERAGAYQQQRGSYPPPPQQQQDFGQRRGSRRGTDDHTGGYYGEGRGGGHVNAYQQDNRRGGGFRDNRGGGDGSSYVPTAHPPPPPPPPARHDEYRRGGYRQHESRGGGGSFEPRGAYHTPHPHDNRPAAYQPYRRYPPAEKQRNYEEGGAMRRNYGKYDEDNGTKRVDDRPQGNRPLPY